MTPDERERFEVQADAHRQAFDAALPSPAAMLASSTPDCGCTVGGKPYHGWSCDCDECQDYQRRGEPRPGEQGWTCQTHTADKGGDKRG